MGRRPTHVDRSIHFGTADLVSTGNQYFTPPNGSRARLSDLDINRILTDPMPWRIGTGLPANLPMATGCLQLDKNGRLDSANHPDGMDLVSNPTARDRTESLTTLQRAFSVKHKKGNASPT